MIRAPWRVVVALAAASSLALLAGCTGSEDNRIEEDAEETAIELTSEEISAQLLDEGEALAEQEPLATVQPEPGVIPGGAVMTLEVLEVVATSTGTVVRMQVTAAEDTRPQSSTFSTREFVNPGYIDDMQLIDPAVGESLAPIEAAEGGRWCECSILERVGPIPIPMTGVFPALEESAKSVDFRFGWFPLIEGLPVTR